MEYRREIDGLRAVAVIPVIFFHAGFQTFSGGFVGVDVFFVISGYLITTIILAEKELGTFSLVNFYERRARRILPALFLVMFVSVPFAWFWLVPTDMEDFSQSLVAVSTFSSNIFFWRESGYWDVDNELKPFLHTWSLAVEEQYYILFPPFLMLMWRFSRRWILGSFALITATSLLLAQWGAYSYPTATFFLLPTRGWELAIGASIAFYFLFRKQTIRIILSHNFIDEALSLVGLLMIGYAVFAFNKFVPYPSFYALVPTIGTGLIILFSSPKTVVGRLLGTNLLVGIGLISYSAYLWHQPLFSFARHRSVSAPSDMLYLALAVLSIALAYLSWRYAEKPFRKKGGISRKSIFAMAAIGSALFTLVGLAGHMTDGFVGRSTKDEILLHTKEKKRKGNRGLSVTCTDSFPLAADCRTSDEPEILVWGDSNAQQLVQGIMASNPNAKIIQMTKTVCGPLFDLSPVIEPEYPMNWSKGCLKFTGNVREWLKENTTIRYAILSSPFATYISNDVLFRNGDRQRLNIESVAKEFGKTLGELTAMGVIPVVFSPMPTNGTDIGRCLVRAEWFGAPLDRCNFRVESISSGLLDAYKMLEIVEKKYPVVRLDKYVCDNVICQTHIGSTFVYRDKGHLSLEGSVELGKMADFYALIVGGASN